MLIIIVAICIVLTRPRALHVDLYVQSIAKLPDRISFDVERALEHVHGQRPQSLADSGHIAW